MDKLVSVLMGVYNCETTIAASIESIINQSYKNWELIIVDDGSTDNSYDIAMQYQSIDQRIAVFKNERNLGLNATLNNCLNHAKGVYIARMDADDDCVEHRLFSQVAFLDSNENFDLVSSPMIFFDESGEWGKTTAPEFPTVEQVVCGSPICHAPVMIRKTALDSVSGYTEDRNKLRVEDVDLWIKLYANGSRCYNIQEPLYRMRNDKNASTRRRYKYRINSTRVRLQGCKKLRLGLKCYIKSFSPMLAGLVPSRIRMIVSKLLYR